MSNILKRKMFKLGGEVSKSHGVGLTHGLKFNKGGKVAPIGSDVYPKVMGPDGQMREGHYLGMFLGPAGAIARSGAGLAAKGLGKIAPEFLKKFGSGRGVKDFVLKSSTGSARPSAKQLARMTPDEIARTVGKYGFGSTGRGTQALRAAQLALAPTGIAGTGIGLAGAAAQRAGKLNPIEADDAPLTKFGKGTLQGLADFNLANLASMGIQKGVGVEDAKSLYELVAGGDKVKKVESIAKTEQKKEEEGMSEMQSEAQRRMAEYYQLLGGGQTNKMMQASKALLAAAPLVSDGDYARAMSAAGGELIEAQEQDGKIAQEAALMTIQEMRQEEAAKQETINQIMLNNGIDSAVEAERIYEAMEKTGSVSSIKQLPLKTDGKQDTALTQTGVVYTDVSNVSGSLFVVYNSAEEPLRTNDYQAALAHAEE